MNRSFRIKALVAALILSMTLPLVACNESQASTDTESTSVTETEIESTDIASDSEKTSETETGDNTGSSSESTDESASSSETASDSESASESTSESESVSDSESMSESDSKAESETESESVADPDSFVYGNGEDIENAGHLMEEDAFALTDRTFDASAAVEKTANEIKEMLADKTSMTEGAVYLVKDPIVLDSDTKYFGNYAAIIAKGGIVIKNVEEVLIKELCIEGNITVENSTGVTLFRLCMTSTGTAISVTGNCSDISVKSCRVTTSGTALSLNAKFASVYQNYFCADKAVVAVGDDIAIQSNLIVSKSLGISACGDYCTVKNNSIEVAADGVGVSLSKSENGLVALNKVTGAQNSILLADAYNCSVILNSAIRLESKNSKNIYFVDNKLGGAIVLEKNNYLICDGNTFPDDKLSHPVVNLENTNFNGDNMHDVDARLEYGADENLLPHTNKDLFLSMERRSTVRDLSLPKSYAFNGYVRNMAKNDGVVIVPPGVYSTTSTLNIQSTHSNTTIYAYGVYQEATKYIKNVDISNTSNITVKGLTIGYALQSAGQIQVLDKLDNNRLLVISSAGFTKEFGQLDSTRFGGGGYFYHPGSYTSWTEIGNWGKYVIVPNADGSLQNEDGTFIIEIGGKDAPKYHTTIEEGEIFTCRLNETNDRTVAISTSKNVLFKDTVTYGYADALCFVIGGTNTEVQFYRHHNLAHSAYEIDKETYDKYVALEKQYNVDLEVYIDEMGRYRGADPRIGSVDATHMASPSKGLTATSTLFENACDDAANQRGNSSALHDIIDNKDGTLTLLYKDYLPETYVNLYMSQGKTEVHPGHQTSAFTTGDRIFIYASNGKVFCDTNVLSAATQYATNAVIYEKETKNSAGEDVTFTWKSTIYAVKVSKSAVDMSAIEGYELKKSSPDMSNKIIVDNLSRNSVGFTFDNCMVRHNRGRFVIKTRDAVITNCTFKDTSMGGVVLSVESTWGESTVPNNVIVTKCLFDGTSKTFNYEANTKYAAVAVEGLGSSTVGKDITVSNETIPCKNITIVGNVFRNVPNNYYVTVSAAHGVTITDNVFETRSTETSKRVGKAIYINGCMNIMISDNTYSEYAKGDNTKVIVVNNYSGLIGKDVEGIFEKDKLAEAAAE